MPVHAELDKAIYLGAPPHAPNVTGNLRGVWLDRSKYIRHVGNGSKEEVYDLATDPDELRNLAASPESLNTLERFRKEAWRLGAAAPPR